MTLKPISNVAKWLRGSLPLPAGAIPLAQEGISGHVCLSPNGRWWLWMGGVTSSMPPETQRAVMEVIIGQLGGTAAAAADKLGVSARTVEAWRSGKAPLPVKSAYLIAQTIADK